MRKLPLIIVEWEDVTQHTGWRNEEAVKDEHISHCKMVGWKTGGDKGNIFIATAFDDDGCSNGRRIIPRGCIRNIRRLE